MFKNGIHQIKKWKVLRGDLVQIIAGKDKGKEGTVLKVVREKNRVVVEGLNLVKKHTKGTEQRKGGIFSKESPIHVSNVKVVDPTSQKPTRIAFRYLEGGEKVRLSKFSGNVIARPEILTRRKTPLAAEGPKDTPAASVLKQTFEQSAE